LTPTKLIKNIINKNRHFILQIVLPSKAIKNERILETLMFQANSGMYRIQESYLEACQQRLQKQDSRFSEWESFDYGL
jgi:RAP1 GTPase activating protein 1